MVADLGMTGLPGITGLPGTAPGAGALLLVPSLPVFSTECGWET